jgi:hypothetical protein
MKGSFGPSVGNLREVAAEVAPSTRVVYVQSPLWRPEGRPPRPQDIASIGIYAGIGRR